MTFSLYFVMGTINTAIIELKETFGFILYFLNYYLSLASVISSLFFFSPHPAWNPTCLALQTSVGPFIALAFFIVS